MVKLYFERNSRREIRDMLLEYMIVNGVTAKEISVDLGIPKSTVYQYVYRRNVPGFRRAAKIMDYIKAKGNVWLDKQNVLEGLGK